MATLARLHVLLASRPVTTDALSTRPATPPAPTVRLSPPPISPPAPSRPSCSPLEVLTGPHDLGAGPHRLMELLHRLACDTVVARAYPVMPSQVTLHQPQELLAAALGCHVVTIWRWARELIATGLVAARAHFTTSKGSTRADGTLYAVAIQPGHRAHLSHDDLVHQWRDLDADRAAGRTAWAALQGSNTNDKASWYLVLRNWAVSPGFTDISRCSFDPCNSPRTVQDVVYALPLVLSAHPDRRAALVGLLGSSLAHLLHDPHSRRWYCRTIWHAYRADLEGRHGLQDFAAKLHRLAADMTEWPGLRSPGALLVTRLQLHQPAT